MTLNKSILGHARSAAMLAVLAGAACTGAARADQTIGPVFVIALENHNWTQPSSPFSGSLQQIYQNPAAPYINSLVTPGNPNAQYVSYASNYHQNVSPVTGNTSHPSEPNYVWSEAGTDFGITNDNQPYGAGGTNQNTTQHLSGLLQAQGKTWKSYQEGIDLVAGSGSINQPGSNSLTNTVASPGNYTVPLTNFSGTSTNYTNQYNGSHQYNYAAKHNPQVFFTDTNGGNNGANTNPLASHYAPMEQLSSDLTSNTYGQYNFITPDQYNDMHTALNGGFNYPAAGGMQTGDRAQIAQGDNFLSIVVPMIMASSAFQNQNATIIIWNDETEGDTASTLMGYTGTEIVISKLAKGNAYNSTNFYTHSSDLKSMQELYGVGGSSATGFLGDAANATDLADLFQTGALPNAGATSIPAPGAMALATLGALGLSSRRRRR
jgi:phosphatidylinositol-3-phosphatase